MNRMLDALAGGALAALVLAVAPAMAAPPQPEIPTPGGIARLPIVLYEIPYAVHGPNRINGFGYTVVTIGNPRVNGQGCRAQVEWLDWDGSAAGLSGFVLIGLDETLEFTSSPAPGAVPSPYFLNVFRNSDVPFEGHAKVRTNCQPPRLLRVDAEAVFFLEDGRLYEIDPIKVVRPTGNVGD